MSKIFRSSDRTKIRPLLTLAALVVGGLLVTSAASRFAVGSIPAAPPLGNSQGRAPERIEAELITIRPTGFDPVDIRRPRGRFILAVNNRSGIHELDLRLDRERGARQQEVRLPRGKLGWKKLIDLPPGGYILTEANHADWVCRITITPN